jgi:Flp pilus assembly protein TadG
MLIKFWRDRRGVVMPMIALGIFTLIVAAGAGIDMGRTQLVQSRLSSALDNAGLAAAASVSTTDISSEANKYFNANFPSGYMGASVGALIVSINADNSVISLSVSASVPTTIMKIAGINSLPITVQSEITRANKGLELVLVMDNTGSMTQSAGGGVSKISAAKTAATNLVNILYGSNTALPNLWIGLVPFTQSVNVGTSHSSWTATTSFNWGTTSWAGCVESRSNGSSTPQYDITDDIPSTRIFPKYYAPDDSNNNWITTTTVHGHTTTSYNISSSQGPNVNCPQTITPINNSKTTLLNAINAMRTGGNTHIDLGLAWGWRLLSPKWRGLWGGSMDTNNLPLDYNTQLMNKAIVLMTDGDNTISNGVYSAYGYPSSGQLGANACVSGNCTNGLNQINARTTAVCNNIKANNSNVIIYTVAFGTSISTTAKNILLACASKPAYFFDSPTAADLQTAFQQIGDSLANLRISK